MKTPLPSSPALRCCWLLLTLAVAASAAPKIDVNRVTPVAPNEPIPVQDFFRSPAMAIPQLNPAGTHLAGLVSTPDDRIRAMVVELDKPVPELAGAGKEYDAIDVNWLNDKRIVTFVAFRKTYGLSLAAADVGNLNSSYPLVQFAMRGRLPRRVAHPTLPLVWIGSNLDSSANDVGVAEIDTDVRSGAFVNLMKAGTGTLAYDDARESNQKHFRKIYPKIAEPLVTDYLGDKNGELAFGLSSEHGVFTLHRFAGDKWSKSSVDLEQVELIEAGNQPDELLVRGPRQPGQPRPLQFWNAQTNQPGTVLLQDTAYDIHGRVYRDRSTQDVVGVAYNRAGPEVAWFSEDYRALQKMVDARFPGLVARIIDGSTDGSRFLISTFSDRQPLTYYWMDLKKHSVGLVKSSMPWLDPQRMRPENIFRYKTAEGHPIDAYVTLPAGVSKASPAPLVVLCESTLTIDLGRNATRQNWGFDPEAQFLASRGYIVLRPNHRGSAGYRWMFPYEDRFAFAAMSDDVTAATQAVIKTGLVDPARVAIMGKGFGGFLALSGTVRAPDLYRCAVSISGVYDWEALLREREYNKNSDPEYNYVVRHLGDPKKEPEKFDAIAPGRHTDRIHASIFIAHGKEDPLTPEATAKRLVSDLEHHQVPVESYFMDDVALGANLLEDRVELYSRIEAFLEKNLKGAK